MSDIAYSNDLHTRYRERTVTGASAVAALLTPVLPPLRRVLDLGCGHGHWLAAFRALSSCEVDGYDGDYIDRSKLEIPPASFHPVRLDQSFKVEGSYDLSISVETAEHLPEPAGLRLVDQLCAASPVVLFSAGIPGQAGDHHINLHPHRYWKQQFAQRGFAGFDFIRPAIWHREDILLCYRQNVHVFARESILQQPAYERLNRQARANCLTLIDEDVLAAQHGIRASINGWLNRNS